MDDDGPIEQRQRARLVRDALAGCDDERVVAAMAALPRQLFMPADARAQAYIDAPVPIGAGQTISQPSLVAHMLALLRLRPGMRVLDIGAGSGYVSALLAMLVGPSGEVFARERQGSLARRTTAALAELAEKSWAPIHYEHGDGAEGWPEHALYDAIHVGAAFPNDKTVLATQLAAGAQLVQPVTRLGGQFLQVIERDDQGELHERIDLAVRFVPILPGRED